MIFCPHYSYTDNCKNLVLVICYLTLLFAVFYSINDFFSLKCMSSLIKRSSLDFPREFRRQISNAKFLKVGILCNGECLLLGREQDVK